MLKKLTHLQALAEMYDKKLERLVYLNRGREVTMTRESYDSGRVNFRLYRLPSDFRRPEIELGGADDIAAAEEVFCGGEYTIFPGIHHIPRRIGANFMSAKLPSGGVAVQYYDID